MQSQFLIFVEKPILYTKINLSQFFLKLSFKQTTRLYLRGSQAYIVLLCSIDY